MHITTRHTRRKRLPTIGPIAPEMWKLQSPHAGANRLAYWLAPSTARRSAEQLLALLVDVLFVLQPLNQRIERFHLFDG